MKSYNFFFNLQPNYFIHLKHLLLSLKMYKRNRVKYNCIIAIDDNNLRVYKNELKVLQSLDFSIFIFSSKIYQTYINSPNNSYVYYIRCLLPYLCTNLDKILYLDTDTIITKEGIEDFYDLDLTNYYAATCLDLITYLPNDKELINTKTDKYFNSGVMLFNINKFKKDGIDKKLKHYVKEWPKELIPFFWDQTLFNWLLKDQILFCSPIFNNIITHLDENNVKIFLPYYKLFGYQQVKDSLKDTVVLHFAGTKIWNKLTPEEKKNMYYYDLVMKIYQENLKKLLDFEFFLLSKE